MRKNLGNKPFTYPQPVWIISTYDEFGNPDAMNAAWVSIGDDHQVFLCLANDHKTTFNIEKNKEFVVSMATEDYVCECDYFGIASANKVNDKIAKTKMHVKKAEFVNAPYFEELPISLECRLISYDKDSCHMFADIINVSVDEKVLDEKGHVDPKKVKPITFDPFNNNYIGLGEVVAKAFNAGVKFLK